MFSALVVVPTVGFGTAFYVVTVRGLRFDLAAESEEALRDVESHLTALFSEAQRSVLTVALNSHLAAALRYETSFETWIMHVKETQLAMKGAYHTLPHAHAFLLGFKDLSKVLTHNGYYGDEIRSQYPFWDSMVDAAENTAFDAVTWGSDTYFRLSQELPFGGGAPKGWLHLVLSGDSILHEVAAAAMQNGVELAVSDATGRVVLSSIPNLVATTLSPQTLSESIRLGRREYLTTVSGPLLQGWRCWSFVPLDRLYAQTRPVMAALCGVGAILLVAGVLLSYLLALRFHSPIRELVRVAGESLEDPAADEQPDSSLEHLDDLAYMNAVFHRIASANERANRLLRRGEFSLKHSILHALFEGSPVDRAEVEETLVHLGVSCRMISNAVVGIEIDGDGAPDSDLFDYQRHLALMEATDRVMRRLEIPSVSVNHGPDRVFVLSGSDSPQHQFDSELRRACHAIRRDIRDRNAFTVTIGVGSTVDDFWRIRDSYVSAVRALDRKLLLGKDRVIHSQEIRFDDAGVYIYPLSKMEAIVNAFRAGDEKTTADLVHRMFDELRTRQDTPVRRVRYTLVQLLSFTSRVVAERGYGSEDVFGPGFSLMEEVERRRTIDEIEAWILTVYTKLIEYHSEQGDSAGSIAGRAKAFIEENFARPISLFHTAEALGISPQYLSRRFRQESGVKYVDFVMRVRLDHAKELLTDPTLTLTDIAAQTGFGNYQYLIRRFKERFGTTPAQYRESRRP